MHHDASTEAISSKLKWLLVVSFIPFLIKVIDYTIIGGYIPLLVFVVLLSLIFWSMQLGTKTRKRIIRLWAVLLILWAIARLSLIILFHYTSVSEAHVESQFNIWFILNSFLHFAFGILLWRKAH